MVKRKGEVVFLELRSRILGPLDTETERRLVLLVHMELDTLAAVSVSGTLVVGTWAVLFDSAHSAKIVF